MSKLNLFLAITAYEDENPTNNPSKNIFKWVNDLQGVSIEEPSASTVKLAPGQVLSLFSGEVALSDDGTTTYDLSLKIGTASTYVLKHNAGTAPVFRTPRSLSQDATSEITVTKNATLATFTSSGGTPLNLATLVIGDEVRIGSQFNVSNQGKFKVLSKTATSFTVENSLVSPEGPVVLGATFEDQVKAYSSAGVQIGDKVAIDSGFSVVSQGTYEITDVQDNKIEFYSINALPQEFNIPENLRVFNQSKKFIYVESDKKVSISINGTNSNTIEPVALGVKLKSGCFMQNTTMSSAEITNNSQETATVTFATAE
jgi:hypothetical protein